MGTRATITFMDNPETLRPLTSAQQRSEAETSTSQPVRATTVIWHTGTTYTHEAVASV